MGGEERVHVETVRLELLKIRDKNNVLRFSWWSKCEDFYLISYSSLFSTLVWSSGKQEESGMEAAVRGTEVNQRDNDEKSIFACLEATCLFISPLPLWTIEHLTVRPMLWIRASCNFRSLITALQPCLNACNSESMMGGDRNCTRTLPTVLWGRK